MLTNCGVGEDFWESLGQQEAFPVAQRLKRLSAMRETWVGSLDQEDPLEKEMATHSSILAWRIPWTEEPGGLQSTGSQRVGHNWVIKSNTEYTYVYTHVPRLPWWLSSKESACSARDTGDVGSIPGLGRSPGEGKATHSSILAWRIPWGGKETRLSDFYSQFHAVLPAFIL